MLEGKMVEHCAPTLAGMKTANLFRYRYTSEEQLEEELSAGNQKLNDKGVFIEVLKKQNSCVLLYVYRRRLLALDLEKPGAGDLLAAHGYTNCEVDACLEHLKIRLEKSRDFPHEIGLFLGYQLPDVTGFIEQRGKNCKCAGLWKVYGNEHEALKLFEKFRHCTDVYRQLFAGGTTIARLTIAA